MTFELRPTEGRMIREADIPDADPRYRYALRRIWNPGRERVCFLCLNPSTADAHVDDATVRLLVGYARRWGAGAIEIVNLYAWRAKNPKALRTAKDPVGPENDAAIVAAIRRGGRLVAAYGALGPDKRRAERVLDLVRPYRDVYALAVTQEGRPHHPRGLLATLTPTLFLPGTRP